MKLAPQKVDPTTTAALKRIARNFGHHLHLIREMHGDGYLRIDPEIPDWSVKAKGQSPHWRLIHGIYSYYGLSYEKFIPLYNAGHIEKYGLDLQKVTKRYMQRKPGQLSVKLLCHLAYEELRPFDLRIEEGEAHALLSALKFEGKLNPPMYLEPCLDAASTGQPQALECVARWMLDLIERIDCPQGWQFFGVRLALVEGHYDLGDYRTPRLRKWPQRRNLFKLLREHPLLRGCVTLVPEPGKRDDDFSYMFHRPGQFWDL